MRVVAAVQYHSRRTGCDAFQGIGRIDLYRSIVTSVLAGRWTGVKGLTFPEPMDYAFFRAVGLDCCCSNVCLRRAACYLTVSPLASVLCGVSCVACVHQG